MQDDHLVCNHSKHVGEYPSPGPITNRSLIRRNGGVVPDLKLYGEDAALVTTNFWSHLAEEYSVEGRAVTEGKERELP